MGGGGVKFSSRSYDGLETIAIHVYLTNSSSNGNDAWAKKAKLNYKHYGTHNLHVIMEETILRTLYGLYAHSMASSNRKQCAILGEGQC